MSHNLHNREGSGSTPVLQALGGLRSWAERVSGDTGMGSGSLGESLLESRGPDRKSQLHVPTCLVCAGVSFGCLGWECKGRLVRRGLSVCLSAHCAQVQPLTAMPENTVPHSCFLRQGLSLPTPSSHPSTCGCLLIQALEVSASHPPPHPPTPGLLASLRGRGVYMT